MSQPNYLDIDSWNRRDTFHFYRKFADPTYNICGNIDVTGAFRRAKSRKQSFFLCCLYFATKAANMLENFKYRREGERVRVYETVHPGSTILYDDNTFGYAYYEYNEDVSAFVENGQRVIEQKKKNRTFVTQPEHNGYIYFSVIPWVSFTSFKHAKDDQGDPSIPRIVFGKYFEEDNLIKLPVSVEVDHALVDGIHVGKYFQLLEKYMC